MSEVPSTTGARESAQTQPQEQTAKVSLLTEGLVIAAVPLFGYVLAFCFEAGYLFHFGLPTVLAELSLQQIIWACLAIFISAAYFVQTSRLFYDIVSLFGKQFDRLKYLVLMASVATFALWYLGSVFCVASDSNCSRFSGN